MFHQDVVQTGDVNRLNQVVVEPGGAGRGYIFRRRMTGDGDHMRGAQFGPGTDKRQGARDVDQTFPVIKPDTYMSGAGQRVCARLPF